MFQHAIYLMIKTAFVMFILHMRFVSNNTCVQEEDFSQQIIAALQSLLYKTSLGIGDTMTRFVSAQYFFCSLAVYTTR